MLDLYLFSLEIQPYLHYFVLLIPIFLSYTCRFLSAFPQHKSLGISTFPFSHEKWWGLARAWVIWSVSSLPQPDTGSNSIKPELFWQHSPDVPMQMLCMFHSRISNSNHCRRLKMSLLGTAPGSGRWQICSLHSAPWDVHALQSRRFWDTKSRPGNKHGLAVVPEALLAWHITLSGSTRHSRSPRLDSAERPTLSL